MGQNDHCYQCVAAAVRNAAVMAALAIRAVTAALLRRRTDTQASPLAGPDVIPLTVPEAGRLLAHLPAPGAAGHWLDWRRRHQARSAWYHRRTRLAQDAEIAPAG
jgi:hypothetical protein